MFPVKCPLSPLSTAFPSTPPSRFPASSEDRFPTYFTSNCYGKVFAVQGATAVPCPRSDSGLVTDTAAMDQISSLGDLSNHQAEISRCHEENQHRVGLSEDGRVLERRRGCVCRPCGEVFLQHAGRPGFAGQHHVSMALTPAVPAFRGDGGQPWLLSLHPL